MLAQRNQLVLVFGYHNVADSIVTLDVFDGLTVDKEVLADHLDVGKPVSPVFDTSVVRRVHHKRRCYRADIVSTQHRTLGVLNIFLPGQIPHDHLFDDLARSFGVSVYPKSAFFLHESVAPVVKLGDIPTEVFDQNKFTTRMLSFIAVCV